MNKAPEAFRTISEVAEDLDLPQHVLRFWETRFAQIKPMKRGGGRRYYRPEDIDLLRGIRQLLYEEGYTIRGLQRILKEQGNKFVIGVGRGEIIPGPERLRHAEGSDAQQQPEPKKAVQSRAEDEETVQRAVAVSEHLGERPRGFFSRSAAPSQPAEPVVLSPSSRQKLQATLFDLLECKRLLDQVRGG